METRRADQKVESRACEKAERKGKVQVARSGAWLVGSSAVQKGSMTAGQLVVHWGARTADEMAAYLALTWVDATDYWYTASQR